MISTKTVLKEILKDKQVLIFTNFLAIFSTLLSIPVPLLIPPIDR